MTLPVLGTHSERGEETLSSLPIVLWEHPSHPPGKEELPLEESSGRPGTRVSLFNALLRLQLKD